MPTVSLRLASGPASPPVTAQRLLDGSASPLSGSLSARAGRTLVVVYGFIVSGSLLEVKLFTVTLTVAVPVAAPGGTSKVIDVGLQLVTVSPLPSPGTLKVVPPLSVRVT
jgi:hypothetical protein